MNVKEVIDEFKGQVDDYKSVFEAIVLMAPGRYQVTFKSHRKMEVAEHTGLTVRGLPVDFRPVSRYTWVNVTRLPVLSSPFLWSVRASLALALGVRFMVVPVEESY